MKKLIKTLTPILFLCIAMVTSAHATDVSATAGNDYSFENNGTASQTITIAPSNEGADIGFYVSRYDANGLPELCEYVVGSATKRYGLGVNETLDITATTALTISYPEDGIRKKIFSTQAVDTLTVTSDSHIQATATGSTLDVYWYSKRRVSYCYLNSSGSLNSYDQASRNSLSVASGVTAAFSFPDSSAVTCYWPHKAKLECSVKSGNPITEVAVKPGYTFWAQSPAGLSSSLTLKHTGASSIYPHYSKLQYNSSTYSGIVCDDDVNNSTNSFGASVRIELSPLTEVITYYFPTSFVDELDMTYGTYEGTSITYVPVEPGYTFWAQAPDNLSASLTLKHSGASSAYPHYSKLQYHSSAYSSVVCDDDSNNATNSFGASVRVELSPLTEVITYYFPTFYVDKLGMNHGTYKGTSITYVPVEPGHTIWAQAPADASSSLTLWHSGASSAYPHYSKLQYHSSAYSGVVCDDNNNNSTNSFGANIRVELSPLTETITYYFPTFYVEKLKMTHGTYEGTPITYVPVEPGNTFKAVLPESASTSMTINHSGATSAYPYYSKLQYNSATYSSVSYDNDNNNSLNTMGAGQCTELSPLYQTITYFFPTFYKETLNLTYEVYKGTPITYVTADPGQTFWAEAPAEVSTSLHIQRFSDVSYPRYSKLHYYTDPVSIIAYDDIDTTSSNAIKGGQRLELSPLTNSITYYFPTFFPKEQGMTYGVYNGSPLKSLPVSAGNSLRFTLPEDSTQSSVQIRATDDTDVFPFDWLRYQGKASSTAYYGESSDNFTVFAGWTHEIAPTAGAVVFWYPTILETELNMKVEELSNRAIFHREYFKSGESLRLQRPNDQATGTLTIRNRSNDKWELARYDADGVTCSWHTRASTGIVSLQDGCSMDITCLSEDSVLCVPSYWIETGILSISKLSHRALYAHTIMPDGGFSTFALTKDAVISSGRMELSSENATSIPYVRTTISTGASHSGDMGANSNAFVHTDQELRLIPQTGNTVVYIPYRYGTHRQMTINGFFFGDKETVTAIANQEIYKIGPGDFTVHVSNRSSVSLAGASVTIDGVTKETDIYGYAVFSGLANGNHEIKVSRENYLDFEGTRTSSNQCHVTAVALEWAGKTEAPYVMSATADHGNLSYDLRNNSLTVYKRTSKEIEQKVEPDTIDLDVRVNWGDHTPAKVVLYCSTNKNKTKLSPSGYFKDLAPAEDLGIGNSFYVYGIAADGTETPRYKIKLQTKKIPEHEGEASINPIDWLKSLELSIPIGFAVGDNVPFFGNSSLSVSLGQIPSAIFSDEASICIAYGVEDAKFKAEADKKNLTAKDYFQKEYKKEIKDLRDAIDKKDTTDIQSKLADLHKKTGFKATEFSTDTLIDGIKKKPEFQLDINGYAQIDKVNGEWTVTEVSISVTGILKNEITAFEKQYIVHFIPVYVDVKLEGSASATGKIGYENPYLRFPGLTITGTAGISLGSGIGVCKVAQAGITGGGDLNLQFGFNETKLNISTTGMENFKPDFSAWLHGALGIEAKLLGQTVASMTFAEGTFYLYPQKTTSSSVLPNTMPSMDSVDLSAPLGKENLYYRDYASDWLGSDARVNMFSAFTQREERTLLTNIPITTELILVEMGGKQLLFWIADNESRALRDRTMLVWSVLNEETGTWSEPEPLWDNGTADYYPAVQGDWIVWQKLNTTMSEDEVSIDDMSAVSEIAAAHWNGTGFDTPVYLTENDVLDCQPVIASGDVGTSVVWTRNSDGNLLGITGTNSILSRTLLKDGTWSEPVVLAEGLNAITALSAVYDEQGLRIAVNEDEDNSLATIDDRNAILLSVDSEGVVTTLTLAESALDPQLVMLGDGLALFFNQEKTVRYLTDLSGEGTVYDTMPAGTITSDGYQVAANANGDAVLLWSGSGENSMEIFGAYYDGETWSADIRFSSGAYRAAMPTGIFSDEGILDIAFVRTHAVEDSEDDGETSTTVYLASLNTLQIVPSCDLAVGVPSYDSSAVTADEDLSISFEVKNQGELAVDGVKAHLYTADRTIDQTVTIEDSALVTGESKTLTTAVLIPKQLAYQALTVEVTPLISGADNLDLTPEDNAISVSIGGCDLETDEGEMLSQMDQTTTKEQHKFWVTVTNSGLDTSPASNVELRDGAYDGTILATNVLPELAVGESSVVCFDVTIDRGEDIQVLDQFYITVSCEQEQFTGNNSTRFALERTEQNVLIDVTHMTAVEGDPASVVVHGLLMNETSSTLNTTLWCAVYSESGKMIGLGSVGDCVSEGYLDTTVSCLVQLTEDYSEGCTAKLFYLDDQTNTPLANLGSLAS